MTLRGWILAVWLAGVALLVVYRPHDPLETDIARQFQAPGTHHWFGTDRLGRDMLSRISLAAARTLHHAGTAAAAGFAASLAVSTLVIASARRWGPGADAVRMAILALRTLPPFLVAMALAVFLRSSELGTITALFVLSFLYCQPVMEAELLHALRHPSVEGAITLGRSFWNLVWQIIMPLVGGRLARYAILDFAGLVAFAALFSFVGLAQPPLPSLGEMLYESRPYVFDFPWLFWGPGLALAAIMGAMWFCASMISNQRDHHAIGSGQ